MSQILLPVRRTAAHTDSEGVAQRTVRKAVVRILAAERLVRNLAEVHLLVHTDCGAAVRTLAAVLAVDLADRILVEAPTLVGVRTGWVLVRGRILVGAARVAAAAAAHNLAEGLVEQILAALEGSRRVAAAAAHRDLVAPVLRESERSRRDRKDSSRGEGVDQTDRQEEP